MFPRIKNHNWHAYVKDTDTPMTWEFGYSLSRIKILPYETEVNYYEMSILTNLMFI